MAVKMGAGQGTPKSTGAVKMPEVVEVTRTVDNTSTGAVKMPPVAEVRADWHGGPSVLRYPTPGPVTVKSSWHVETKVIGPVDDQPAADPSPVAETK